jgi:hypothetical protein
LVRCPMLPHGPTRVGPLSVTDAKRLLRVIQRVVFRPLPSLGREETHEVHHEVNYFLRSAGAGVREQRCHSSRAQKRESRFPRAFVSVSRSRRGRVVAGAPRRQGKIRPNTEGPRTKCRKRRRTRSNPTVRPIAGALRQQVARELRIATRERARRSTFPARPNVFLQTAWRSSPQRTNSDLSGCTQPDRSCVELSRFAGDRPLRIQFPRSFHGISLAARNAHRNMT